MIYQENTHVILMGMKLIEKGKVCLLPFLSSGVNSTLKIQCHVVKNTLLQTAFSVIFPTRLTITETMYYLSFQLEDHLAIFHHSFIVS